MINKRALYLLGCCGAVFAASLAGTLVARSQPSSDKEPCGSPLAKWLDLEQEAANQIEGLDPSFAIELKSFQEELSGARSGLATLLEDDNASNERIREQIEACIDKHNELERRVARYLLKVRDHLTPAQQKKLFRLCAEGVRKGRGHRWGRKNHGDGEGAGRCKTCGRGGGGGKNCECCGRGGGGGRAGHGEHGGR